MPGHGVQHLLRAVQQEAAVAGEQLEAHGHPAGLRVPQALLPPAGPGDPHVDREGDVALGQTVGEAQDGPGVEAELRHQVPLEGALRAGLRLVPHGVQQSLPRHAGHHLVTLGMPRKPDPADAVPLQRPHRQQIQGGGEGAPGGVLRAAAQQHVLHPRGRQGLHLRLPFGGACKAAGAEVRDGGEAEAADLPGGVDRGLQVGASEVREEDARAWAKAGVEALQLRAMAWEDLEAGTPQQLHQRAWHWGRHSGGGTKSKMACTTEES